MSSQLPPDLQRFEFIKTPRGRWIRIHWHDWIGLPLLLLTIAVFIVVIVALIGHEKPLALIEALGEIIGRLVGFHAK